MTTIMPVELQVNWAKNIVDSGFTVTQDMLSYAAYIDSETYEFDQTQMKKLTLTLDPNNEFVWKDETCNKGYSYFQELLDHYEI